MARADKGIEVEGLVRRFKEVEAVAGIDIAIEPGEIYGFLGPNGAGKSTTVHMLTTLLPPTAGRASVAGFDVALALIHDPSILFLDEPTTGLDPQSRSALWDEVGRLARDEGVTVFLTTQYLEEADVLADRVGIIDHGRIVAEGTPAQLKAEIGRPTVEATPGEGSQIASVAAVLA